MQRWHPSWIREYVLHGGAPAPPVHPLAIWGFRFLYTLFFKCHEVPRPCTCIHLEPKYLFMISTLFAFVWVSVTSASIFTRKVLVYLLFSQFSPGHIYYFLSDTVLHSIILSWLFGRRIISVFPYNLCLLHNYFKLIFSNHQCSIKYPLYAIDLLSYQAATCRFPSPLFERRFILSCPRRIQKD